MMTDTKYIVSDFLHLRISHVPKTKASMGCMIEVFLKFIERYFVARFISSVVFRVLLDGIICEMYIFVAAFDVEFL
jgi:accessory gene regulator protein AgrB